MYIHVLIFFHPRFAKLDLMVICGCLPAVKDFVYHLCPQLQAQQQRDETRTTGKSPSLFSRRGGAGGDSAEGGGGGGIVASPAPAPSPPSAQARPGWPERLRRCCDRLADKIDRYGSSSSTTFTGALSTGRSGKSLVGSTSHDQTPMRSQCETDWSTTVAAAADEDPVERMTRSVHQQATRDYHSHLYQNWWDQA